MSPLTTVMFSHTDKHIEIFYSLYVYFIVFKAMNSSIQVYHENENLTSPSFYTKTEPLEMFDHGKIVQPDSIHLCFLTS